MVPPARGGVILVRFPFSDLSRTKLRPVVVLADAGHSDWILGQVTNKPYGDFRATKLETPASRLARCTPQATPGLASFSSRAGI